MPFQPAPACASATLTFRVNSTNEFYGQNVLNFNKQDNTGFGQSDVDTLADLIETWHNLHLSEIQPVSILLTDIYVRGIASQVDVFAVRNPNHAGTQTGDAMSSKVTIAVKFGTGATGRTARGRAFQCGLAESQCQGKVVTTAYAGALISAWEELPLLTNPEGYDHVVLSRWENRVLRTNALPQNITTYALSDLVIDTRRKRV